MRAGLKGFGKVSPKGGVGAVSGRASGQHEDQRCENGIGDDWKAAGVQGCGDVHGSEIRRSGGNDFGDGDIGQDGSVNAGNSAP